MAALRDVAGFDYSVMFAYCGEARPIDLYDDFLAGKRRVFVTDYQEGPYLLDPFFLASTTKADTGLHRLKDLAPNRFYQSEYFRSYYVQTGLPEEFGYFVRLPGNVTTVISLMRADHSPQFSAREFRELRACEPVVRALGVKHWQDLHRRFFDDDPDHGRSGIQHRIEYAFHTFGKSVLTPRESEVVEFVLKGYSSNAIGKILEISPGTVRIRPASLVTGVDPERSGLGSPVPGIEHRQWCVVGVQVIGGEDVLAQPIMQYIEPPAGPTYPSCKC